jgi:hypothetical protein
MTLLAIGEGDEASALINHAQNADPPHSIRAQAHTPAARRAQALQGALDLGNQSGRHPTVAGRRLELGMSEQRLNHANVRAALEQMGREAMTIMPSSA